MARQTIIALFIAAFCFQQSCQIPNGLGHGGHGGIGGIGGHGGIGGYGGQEASINIPVSLIEAKPAPSPVIALQAVKPVQTAALLPVSLPLSVPSVATAIPIAIFQEQKHSKAFKLILGCVGCEIDLHNIGLLSHKETEHLLSLIAVKGGHHH